MWILGIRLLGLVVDVDVSLIEKPMLAVISELVRVIKRKGNGGLRVCFELLAFTIEI